MECRLALWTLNSAGIAMERESPRESYARRFIWGGSVAPTFRQAWTSGLVASELSGALAGPAGSPPSSAFDHGIGVEMGR